jgi:hypothetical protein
VKLAGTSLLPAIRKQKIQPRDLFFEHQTSCAILSDGWKLVRANGRQPWELIHLTIVSICFLILLLLKEIVRKDLVSQKDRW